MSIYDITYNKRVVELLPPDKRYMRMVSFLKAMVQQLQYLHTFLFGEYRTGSKGIYSFWNPIATYNAGDIVIYNESVYLSLINSNTDVPGLTGAWKLYHEFFIGVEERLAYNTQKLVLEYALNNRFNRVFRQPPLQSDIYITNNIPQIGVFVVGYTEDQSSISYFDRTYEFIINSYALGSFYNYTINVPVAVMDEPQIRKFANRYNPVGLQYNINPY